MKNILRLTLCICTLALIISCQKEDGQLNENERWCDNPITERFFGIVVDNYTLQPIENATVEYFNIGEWERDSIMTGPNGFFQKTETNCVLFGDKLFNFNSISHPDYVGYANTSSTNDIYMFKTNSINIILKNSDPNTSKQLIYSHHFCIQPNDIGTCYKFGDVETLINGAIDTITVDVAEGELLNFKYRVNEDSFTYHIFNLDESTETTIEY